jgi:hypothetical protein
MRKPQHKRLRAVRPSSSRTVSSAIETEELRMVRPIPMSNLNPSNADILRAIAGWQLPLGLEGRELFLHTAGLAAVDPTLGAAFADPTKSGLFVKSLRATDAYRQTTMPTMLGSTLAAQLARSHTGIVNVGLGHDLAGMSERVAVITEAIRGPQLKLARMIENAQAAIVSWQPHFARFGEAMQELADEQRRLDEQTDKFVARHGWPVPISLPQRAYKHVVSRSGVGKREVNGLMVRSFRPTTSMYRIVREVLDESPDFVSRRPLLRQVYAAQRSGHWYLVINGLLPLVEGVLIDATFPTGTRPKSVKPGVERLAEAEDTIRDSGFRALETMIVGAGSGLALFESYAPPPGIEPRSLNRHGVLHGSARRYGTEQNATRLFLLVVLLAECLAIRRALAES